MPIEILMPALSPTMTEGNLVRWSKKEGDEIHPGDIIAEIETDKATMEVDAIDSGTLAKILVKAGSGQVAVNSIIGIIKEEGDTDAEVQEAINRASNQSSQISNANADENTVTNINIKQTSQYNDANQAIQSDQKRDKHHRIKASPLAKKLAARNNVNLEKIQGTGPRDRIIKNDIINFLEQDNVKKTEVNSEQSQQFNPEQRKGEKNDYIISASPMRKAIARRLTESKQNIPHFYLSIKCEVSKMLEFRNMINKQAKINKDGIPEYKISVNDIVIKASAMALKAIPEVNASWIDDNIIQHKNIDISVAVAVDGGLFTPIIADANHKTLKEISLQVRELAKKAKEGKLMPQEFEGGSISISNLGMYDIDQFNAIINPPQSAILAIGTMKKEQIVSSDDSFIIGHIINVTLSCDHRVVDGAVAARFLAKFKQYLSDPITMLV